VHGALAASVNTVAVKLLFQTGIEPVIGVARKLGVSSHLDEVPSIVLSTSDISLFEMMTAYSRIVNISDEVELRAISSIMDKTGKIIYERSQNKG
jgi:membrane peptidoglycan carboxypeptidase